MSLQEEHVILLFKILHQLCPFQYKQVIFIFSCPGDGVASESNFDDIIQTLGPDELRKLFHALSIKQYDIEKAERRANTDDVDLKARAVLRWWKKTNGRKATRDVILEALAKCQDKQTKLNLQEQLVKRGWY